MKRVRQTFEEIVNKLSPIEAHWKDEFAEKVIRLLQTFPIKSSYGLPDVTAILKKDFDAGLTVLRLFLDMSKDEFTSALRAAMGTKGIGVTEFRTDPNSYAKGLNTLGITSAIKEQVGRPTKWTDVLIERLKSGRGSAIKGQTRAKFLEDFTEELVRGVFGKGNYHTRCQFVGRTGTSKEKTDFAIPSREDPRILIEAKAYGATGSKQTDVLGDINRIIAEKRHDTTLLLVTDGVTWQARASDLRKLLKMQNEGYIHRIYTTVMARDLQRDLRQLKAYHGLTVRSFR